MCVKSEDGGLRRGKEIEYTRTVVGGKGDEVKENVW